MSEHNFCWLDPREEKQPTVLVDPYLVFNFLQFILRAHTVSKYTYPNKQLNAEKG